MERYRIGIVIPALNEAKTIEMVVASATLYGIPIVVDDSSNDDTGRLAATAGASVVRHDLTKGYDQTLNSGFERASELGCDFIVTIDADGQHDPDSLLSIIQALEDGADVVIGIRDRRQRLAEHLFSWVAMVKWGIRDPLCGMKGYRLSLYRNLGHFDSYNSIGTELALFAAKNRCRIMQLPVKTRKRIDSPRFGKRLAANTRILRALWLGVRCSDNCQETGHAG